MKAPPPAPTTPSAAGRPAAPPQAGQSGASQTGQPAAAPQANIGRLQRVLEQCQAIGRRKDYAFIRDIFAQRWVEDLASVPRMEKQ